MIDLTETQIEYIRKGGKNLYYVKYKSEYGLQVEEFENLLIGLGLNYEKQVGNIFIPDSEVTSFMMYLMKDTVKFIKNYLKENRLNHIKEIYKINWIPED